jgi:hypothetical protein
MGVVVTLRKDNEMNFGDNLEKVIEAEVEKRVAARATTASAPDTAGRKYVVVRTYSAGVFAGYLDKKEGDEVELIQARRCRKFVTGNVGDCTDLARDGVQNGSTIRPPVDRVVLQWIEILDTSLKAQKSIEEYPE